MKLSKDIEMDMPYALHIANKNKILTIVEMGDRKLQRGGIPAVLTDGVYWYSAELIEDPKEAFYVAAAVNMYEHRYTARFNAESRWG